jgi:hypothetical protein
VSERFGMLERELLRPLALDCREVAPWSGLSQIQIVQHTGHEAELLLDLIDRGQ